MKIEVLKVESETFPVGIIRSWTCNENISVADEFISRLMSEKDTARWQSAVTAAF
jgi:hypothetical protein